MNLRSIQIAAVGLLLVCIAVGTWYTAEGGHLLPRFSDTEAGFEEAPEAVPTEDVVADEFDLEEVASITSLPTIAEPLVNGRIRWSAYWEDMTREELAVYGSYKRPTGTPRVGVQAGHWKLSDVPDELAGLKASSGARGGGYTEQEIVLEIAEHVKKMLEAEGVIVELFPATIPIDYAADVFISIHADGSDSTAVSGFKISGPRRDFSGKSEELVDALYESYERATDMRRDPNITRRMNGYYAFNWRRYDHAVHPMTPAAIVETGFMTNAADRAIIVSKPEIAARGIATGVLTFLGL